MTAIRVFKTAGRADPVEELQPIQVDATKISAAKRQARAELEKKWAVRSINAMADGSGLVAYVRAKPAEAKPVRGKPVKQAGLVGKGRSLIDKVRGTKKRKKGK